MIDFKKMRTTQKSYMFIPDWHSSELKFALEISGESGWEFLENDNVPEEVRKSFSEEELEYGKFFVSCFDRDALYALLPYIEYDMDIQAAHEEQDYREMKEEWNAHRGKKGDLYTESDWYLYENSSRGMEFMFDEEDEELLIDEYDVVDWEEYEETGDEENDIYEAGIDIYEDAVDGEKAGIGGREASLPKSKEEEMTEEEALEYDRKRDGRRYISSTVADIISRTCEEEAIMMLLKENEETIIEWLSGDNTEKEIVLRHDDGDTLDIVARHEDSVLCRYSGMEYVLCLEKDETMDIGYRIVEIYLDMVTYMKKFSAQDENAPVRRYYSITPEEVEEREEIHKKFFRDLKNIDIFA